MRRIAPYSFTFGGLYDREEYLSGESLPPIVVDGDEDENTFKGFLSAAYAEGDSQTRSVAGRQQTPYGTPGVARTADERLVASWDDSRGPVTYALVAQADVNADVRRAVELGCRFAVAHMGMTRTPAIRYFREATDDDGDAPSFRHEERGGFADRRGFAIALNADESPRLLAGVAAHEVRHLTQDGKDWDREEVDATAYGEWALGVLSARSSLSGLANAVHVCERRPLSCETLKGVADTGDVVVARLGEGPAIFRNDGTKSTPLWSKHWAACPVPVGPD